jgi:hypothetical protein
MISAFGFETQAEWFSRVVDSRPEDEGAWTGLPAGIGQLVSCQLVEIKGVFD